MKSYFEKCVLICAELPGSFTTLLIHGKIGSIISLEKGDGCLKEFIRKSLLKPWDVVIILFLIVLSFLPIIVFSYQQTNVAPDKEAILRVDGEEIKTFPLIAGKTSYTFLYEDTDGDTNLIEIDGERIRIKEADCGDQVCVRRGWVSKNGETIVCLPHKLVIEVRSTDGSGEDGLIY